MVRRHAAIRQFGGALVFPGGCVDAGDEDDAWIELCRDGAETEAGERRRRIAAIREGFEESGVLLARDRGTDAFVSPERMTALGADREAIDKGDLPFREFIERERLELAIDRLVQIGHWITPTVIPRRFDTVFFAARIPHSLELRHDGREAVESGWSTPATFLAEADSGQHELLFPTRCNLLRVAEYDRASTLIEAEGDRAPCTVLPVPERDGDYVILRIPTEAGYPISSERLPMPGR